MCPSLELPQHSRMLPSLRPACSLIEAAPLPDLFLSSKVKIPGKEIIWPFGRPAYVHIYWEKQLAETSSVMKLSACVFIHRMRPSDCCASGKWRRCPTLPGRDCCGRLQGTNTVHSQREKLNPPSTVLDILSYNKTQLLNQACLLNDKKTRIAMNLTWRKP